MHIQGNKFGMMSIFNCTNSEAVMSSCDVIVESLLLQMTFIVGLWHSSMITVSMDLALLERR